MCCRLEVPNARLIVETVDGINPALPIIEHIDDNSSVQGP